MGGQSIKVKLVMAMACWCRPFCDTFATHEKYVPQVKIWHQ